MVGAVIGGAIGTVVGSLGGPLVTFFASTTGSAALGYFSGLGSDASFNFYNSSEGYWNSIDIGDCCTATTENGNTLQTSLDSDGVDVMGSFDAGSNTATITVVAK